MIWITARYLTPTPYTDASMVEGQDGNGKTETLPRGHRIFRQADEGPEGYLSGGGVIDDYVEPEPVAPQQILGPISAAILSVSAGEITGIETSVNFGAAFMIETDTYWVFFTTPEPDTNYLVLGNCPFVRYTDYIEITAADLAEVSLTTWRVKEA